MQQHPVKMKTVSNALRPVKTCASRTALWLSLLGIIAFFPHFRPFSPIAIRDVLQCIVTYLTVLLHSRHPQNLLCIEYADVLRPFAPCIHTVFTTKAQKNQLYRIHGFHVINYKYRPIRAEYTLAIQWQRMVRYTAINSNTHAANF